MTHTKATRVSHTLLFILFGGAVLSGPLLAQESAAEVLPLEESTNLFGLLLKGGWVMIPIALASVLALTLTIERFISIRKKKVIPPNFMAGLISGKKDEAFDAEAGDAYCKQNPCVLGNLIRAGLSKIGQGEKKLEHTLEEAGAREVDRLKRSLKPLSMIATIAPLLGLLGTVYGMISAFQAASAAGVGKSDVLAQGIYEALVTTAAGLTLAIPVLIVYQVLNNRIDGMVDDLDRNAEAFMSAALPGQQS